MEKREIKFRAWNGVQKQMVYGVGITPEEFKSSSRTGHDGLSINPMLPGRYTILQCTGLKDKNGKEIYEGDVITALTNRYGHSAKGVVEYVNASFAVNTGQQLIDDEEDYYFWFFLKTHYDFEVIGNIYENAELVARQ